MEARSRTCALNETVTIYAWNVTANHLNIEIARRHLFTQRVACVRIFLAGFLRRFSSQTRPPPMPRERVFSFEGTMNKIHVPSRIPSAKTAAEAKRMIAAAKRLLKAAGVK